MERVNKTILVTGATGGVGSIAVAMLASLGYEVAASTGKADMVASLVERGADVRATCNDGRTPLHWAAHQATPRMSWVSQPTIRNCA